MYLPKSALPLHMLTRELPSTPNRGKLGPKPLKLAVAVVFGLVGDGTRTLSLLYERAESGWLSSVKTRLRPSRGTGMEENTLDDSRLRLILSSALYWLTSAGPPPPPCVLELRLKSSFLCAGCPMNGGGDAGGGAMCKVSIVVSTLASATSEGWPSFGLRYLFAFACVLFARNQDPYAQYCKVGQHREGFPVPP